MDLSLNIGKEGGTQAACTNLPKFRFENFNNPTDTISEMVTRSWQKNKMPTATRL
jgi:hypothetical protein